MFFLSFACSLISPRGLTLQKLAQTTPLPLLLTLLRPFFPQFASRLSTLLSPLSLRTFVTVSRASPSVAVLSLDKGPANVLSLEMSSALAAAVSEIESDRAVQCLVLKSSNQKIFCAGLDIQEMAAPDPARLADFWRTVQQVFINLYGSRLSTFAAIEGHAPAGGCLLSMCCDYR